MNTVLSPYLHFNGNCKEAMEFYKSVLGGELKISTYADMPDSLPEHKDRIMHAELRNGSLSFMASDGQPGVNVPFGDNIDMSIIGSDEPKITEYFNKLSEGGKVEMPLAKQFWGDTFGMFKDKYGVNWMFNISPASN